MAGRWLAGLLLCLPALAAAADAAERAAILAHGPWPAPLARDPGNRASGDAQAIAYGRRLFFDPRLSADARVACASCHRPERDFSDGLPRGVGLAEGRRNTPALADVARRRWFGWDGASDSLWAQSLRPILDPLEMGLSVAGAARLLRTDRDYRCRHVRVFGRLPGADEALLVEAAKALAAFQETLGSGRSPFDAFRDALARGDRAAMGRYPAAARRGLALFVGRGRCSVCHFGPDFSHGEFGDIGVPFFLPGGGVDAGRHAGIARLLASPYNLLGRYNDDASRGNAVRTRHVVAQHRNFGEFRVPSLRNVARTGPYLHDGSLATLEAVVRHYATVDPERLHADGEPLVGALDLAEGEIADLVAFLETLSGAPPALPAEPPPCRAGAPRFRQRRPPRSTAAPAARAARARRRPGCAARSVPWRRACADSPAWR